jgi:xylulokinase
MSLMGIDAGTTGCKAAVFSEDGQLLNLAYREYDYQRPQPGWAELDSFQVWEDVKETIREAAAGVKRDPITALAVSSLGEAVVPLSAKGEILGPSILNFDSRGVEYEPALSQAIGDERLYRINGNRLSHTHTLPKLMWMKEHQPGLYERVDRFLLWGGFISHQLGASPFVDYSLANRTLLFDIDRLDWSDQLLELSGLDRSKLPSLVASGELVGMVSKAVAAELGLSENISIVAGAHDQCSNAVGCGVIDDGQAAYGMGTFHCITPVFSRRFPDKAMLNLGLNTEHHAVPGKLVTFIYNQGGSLVKWFREVFAAEEHRKAQSAGMDIYDILFQEISTGAGKILVLPHFAPTGPPYFINDSCGVMLGLSLDTQRGDILKGIVESTAYYLKEVVMSLPEIGLQVNSFRAVGGGSKSDVWVQICADIFNRPFIRPAVTEAGTLGAAIMAGVGSGSFSSYSEAVAAMVRQQRIFEPDQSRQPEYEQNFERYRQLWPLMADYVRDVPTG